MMCKLLKRQKNNIPSLVSIHIADFFLILEAVLLLFKKLYNNDGIRNTY